MSMPTIPSPRVNNSNNEISCSIEETNRIRAQLGLKPLRLSPSEKGKKLEKETTIKEEKDKSKKSKIKSNNIGNVERERLLFAPKSIAQRALDEDEDDVDDLKQWINNLRRRTTELKKKITDTDVSNEENTSRKKKGDDRGKEGVYNAHDVEGMKIRHDISSLMDEGGVVLTLADRNILNESGNDIHDGEDQLESVQISEKERGRRNANLRRKQAKEFDPYDADALDEDETNDLEDKKITVIQKGGVITQQTQQGESKHSPADGSLTDAISAPTIESDYYTPAEYAATFKKSRKHRNARKKRRKRDVAMLMNNGVPEEGGSKPQTNRSQVIKTDAIEAARRAAKAAREFMDDDDDDDEGGRYAALEQARKQQRAMREKQLEQIVDRLGTTTNEDEQGVVLDELREFVRGVGDEVRSIFPSRLEESDGEEHMDSEKHAVSSVPEKHDGNLTGRLETETKENGTLNKAPLALEDAATREITEEAPVSSSVAAALAAFRSKGDLRAKPMRVGRVRDKLLDVPEDDSPSGKKEIKLEYVDEYGRELTPKEAFRMMCYKFHGKGPGKNKREKRLARYLQELGLKSRMSGGDTPLGGVKALKEEQRKIGAVGVVVQGRTAMRDALRAGEAESSNQNELPDSGGSRKQEDVTNLDLKRAREENIEFEFGSVAARGKRLRRN